jgi:hypothetical protein
MKVSKKEILQGLVVIVGAYLLYSKPLGTALTAIGLGAIVFAFTKMYEIVLIVFTIALLAKPANKMFKPEPLISGQEGFQARDAPTVQARLESVHTKAPLAPKVHQVTGVLESADILDNSPLQAFDHENGLPGASIPASAKARVAIYTPNEGFVAAPNGSVETAPMENPVLQNGQDGASIETALANEGADMPEPEVASSDMAGVASNAGAA